MKMMPVTVKKGVRKGDFESSLIPRFLLLLFYNAHEQRQVQEQDMGTLRTNARLTRPRPSSSLQDHEGSCDVTSRQA